MLISSLKNHKVLSRNIEYRVCLPTLLHLLGPALFPIRSFNTKVLLHATDFTTIDILLPNPSNTLKDVLIPHLLQFRGIYHLLTFEFSMAIMEASKTSWTWHGSISNPLGSTITAPMRRPKKKQGPYRYFVCRQ